MEAAFLTAAPAPMPIQDSQARSSTHGQTEAADFPAFLAAAANPDEQSEQQIDPQKTSTEMQHAFASASGVQSGQEINPRKNSTEPIAPDTQDTILAAEFAALAFQNVPGLPPEQPAKGQALLDKTLTPILNELSQGKDVATPALSPSGDLTSLLQGDAPLQQTPFVVPANFEKKTLTPTTDKQGVTPTMKAEVQTSSDRHGILSQQLQAILDKNPQNTITLHQTPPAHTAEALDNLSSAILPSADQGGNLPAFITPEALLQGVVDGKNPTDKTEGTYQSIEEQFISAKLEALSEKKNSEGHQQESSQQGNNTNQSAPSTLTASLNSDPQGSHFLLNTPSLTPSTQVTAGTNQPILSTPGHYIPAEEVINHLVERFSTNPRLQTSKISLNLSPAELGTLKIDIMVQGDSIKAHIVAGSQQIQDTIEKQMPRLRSVLEQQGFTIDDFQVTLESASSNNNNFFDQQFTSSQEQQAHKSIPNSVSLQETPFSHTLNTAEDSLPPIKKAGVNLNI